MSEEYAPRLGKFVGFEHPPTLALRALQWAELSATRLHGSFVSGTPVQLDCNNGYLLCLQRLSLPASPYWVDGRPIPMRPLRSGQFLLLDLNQEHASLSYGDVDCISTYISREALERFYEEHELPRGGSLRSAEGVALDDKVISNLGECLVPAFEQPTAPNQLFVDHVALALLSHLTAAYGEYGIVLRPARGGLAPWQERRAKEMLLANIDGKVGLHELAAACELSRSHFARAFKVTTGTSPLQWLAAERVERAKNLLLNSRLSIHQVAHQCGFSDQGHLSRTFVKFVSAAPGRWRRLRRL